MIDVQNLFERIRSRQFNAEDAKGLIRSSYYFAATHPDVHINLSLNRPADFHFQHLPQYEQRGSHSMFRSMDEAAQAVAAALNSEAGAAATRFLSFSDVNRVALYSRSGAQATGTMTVRSAIASMGARTGTMYGETSTLIVVVVLSIFNGQVVITTAYPAGTMAANRPVPPEAMDLLEYRNQTFTYPAAIAE